MALRIIKNYTDTSYIIHDLGDLEIPAQGAIDIGGTESRLIELADSEDLLKVLSLGVDKIQVNDGMSDFQYGEGIDLIRRVSKSTPTDKLGRWIVRSDSRRTNYDAVFSGCGDDIVNKQIGGGVPFTWDFSAPEDDPKWIAAPAGYKRQRLDWSFIETTYLKEGSLYFYNAPKGAYLDFKLLIPAGYPYKKKYIDSEDNPYWEENYTVVTEETIIGQWVINHWVEGSCPMGDPLNTESAHENPSPTFIIYRCEITAPISENISDFHGHFSLEMYRGRTRIW